MDLLWLLFLPKKNAVWESRTGTGGGRGEQEG